ncbi:aldo/keto reductase [Natranaeroarchaeum sulfidigenes]|uniref:Aryl-alcohol dehydrogenase related enzyme n=1 Tax=Natranaeroarchaeum sulfidigenes TaxID=2784880 RepID=A0A897MT94_9EURY|nr:aldo/keto reductase [Natranaeroarchaeum sulfidigenes]QSG03722.1 Aryl-alcohol dehydrogenase related enzyme [Natranaeroarchaeum sulfidigenes]
MNYRTLGESDVEVSEVGFGAWVVGTDWWGDRDEQQAIDMVRHAVDRGITFFDTGDVYGHGASEEIIGQALADRREEVTIGTKIGYDFYNNPQAGHGELPKEVTPEWIETALDRSLDRLDTDYVDVLQLHNANVEEVDRDVLETLDELQESGRVDAVGWALGPSIGWLAEGEAAIEHEFDALQTVFNLFEQGPGMHFVDEIDRQDADTSIMARVPHSSGLLNEQVTPETELEDGDHRSHRPTAWYETGWEKVEQLRFLERDGERTMAQAAIQWLLYHDSVATVTPTFRTTDDIDAWASASDAPALSDGEYERVQELYAENFGIERDDGMDAYRSSVGGEDIESAGVQPASGD